MNVFHHIAQPSSFEVHLTPPRMWRVRSSENSAVQVPNISIYNISIRQCKNLSQRVCVLCVFRSVNSIPIERNIHWSYGYIIITYMCTLNFISASWLARHRPQNFCPQRGRWSAGGEWTTKKEKSSKRALQVDGNECRYKDQPSSHRHNLALWNLALLPKKAVSSMMLLMPTSNLLKSPWFKCSYMCKWPRLALMDSFRPGFEVPWKS